MKWTDVNIQIQRNTYGTFVLAIRSWNLIAFTDLRVFGDKFIYYDHGPVNPAWEVGS